MQPLEPPVAAVPTPPAAGALPETGTSLDLPAQPAVPAQPAAPVEPAEAAPPGPLGNLVAAHFQRVEVAMLARVLITTLGAALPTAMIRVQRRRSLWQRLTGRPGEPIGISVVAAERTLTFQAPELGVAEASVGHTVRGVVLSSQAVPLAQWLDELGELLEQVGRDDETTRLALERALLH